MKSFYRVAFVEIGVVISAFAFKYLIETKGTPGRNSSATNIFSNIFSSLLSDPLFDECARNIGPYEHIGRVASSAVSFPLFFEYLFDQLVTYLKPSLIESDRFYDPVGQGLIRSSLLFTSYLPLLLDGGRTCVFKDLCLPLSQFLTVAGVLGNLHCFANSVWRRQECIWMLSFYLFVVLVETVAFQFKDSLKLSLIHMPLISLTVIHSLTLLFFVYISRDLPKLFEGQGDSSKEASPFFATRKYLCSILFLGLAFYLFGLCFFTYLCYLYPSRIDVNYGSMISVQLFGILAFIEIPRRMLKSFALSERNRLIQKEIDQKKTFVRYISHEIRSPLSTAGLGLDCIKNLVTQAIAVREELNLESLAELIHDCQISCSVALSTLNDLLLFDKIENQMVQLECQELACDAVLQVSIRPFLRQLQVAGMHFSVNVDPRLSCCTMVADHLKIDQVVRNLISNAMKFTPLDGCIVINACLVSLEPSCQNECKGRMRFEVTDSGAGISPENQAKLFHQYVQIEPEKLQNGKGSGLGLWISKAILDLHGGSIGVHSEGRGRGSTFFEIPVTYTTPTSAVAEINNPVGTPMETCATIIKDEKKREEEPRTVSTVFDKTPDVKMDDFTNIGVVEEGRVDYQQSHRSILVYQAREADHASLRIKDLAKDHLSLGPERKIKVMIADDSTLTRKMIERVLTPYDLIIHHSNNGKEVVEKVLKSMNEPSLPSTSVADDTVDCGRSGLTHVEGGEMKQVIARTGSGVDGDENKEGKGKELVVDESCTPYDVVIIDYLMPGMNGAEAIQAMREAGYDGFICAVTGSPSASDREKLSKSGASIIMSKPFDVKVFEKHLKGK